MRVRLFAALLVFVSAGVLTATACGSSTSQIVGEWERQGSFRGWGERIEFFKDGSVVAYDVDGIDIEGEYSFPEDGVIKFDAGLLFGVARHEYSLKGDRLTFQDNRLGKVEYVRVKKK